MRHQEFNNRLEKVLKESNFLNAIHRYKENSPESILFKGDDIRRLTKEEREVLTAAGNRAESWDSVLVSKNFTPDNIYNSVFSGKCILGNFTGKLVCVDKGVEVKTGINSSYVADSEIDDAAVCNTSLVLKVLILKGACVYQTSAVVSSNTTPFGNGSGIRIGVLGEGRYISSFADMDMESAVPVVLGASDTELQEFYRKFAESYADLCSFDRTVVSEGALVKFAGRVQDTYIGPGGVVDGSARVEHSTLMSDTDRPCGTGQNSVVISSVVQKGSSIRAGSVVEDSVVMEESCIDSCSEVKSSIIGRSTGVSRSCIKRSLIGSFSITGPGSNLISAVWPKGRIETGSGVTMAPDNSIRAYDQEMFCGEGVVFGNRSICRYPADLSHSPYAVFAPGIETHPQKVSYPFSLISKRTKDIREIPDYYNEICPGHILHEGLYSLLRREELFLGSKSSTERFERIFSKRIVDLMMESRDRLTGVPKRKRFYTSEDFRGLGMNVLMEERRQEALSVYNFYIDFALLKKVFEEAEIVGLDSQLSNGNNRNSKNITDWEHWRLMAEREGVFKEGAVSALKRFSRVLDKVARETARSRERIDRYDEVFIPDYRETRTLADKDQLVLSVKEDVLSMKGRIEALIGS
ncbi:MAG: DUF4954 family protein [Chitinivibrionales bacterium]